VVYISDEEGILGLIALKDTLRQETIAAIRELQSIGVEAIMITGDNEETAKAIASESNIKEYYASCLPETKVETIKKLKKKYGTVAMVGDGINDAPALATADIGMAIGTGTDVAMEAADITLIRGDLNSIADAIFMSKMTIRNIKQNLFWALAYN
uniref:HAD-IC family P-type ATPase n=1 Tax=Proteus mirabilis TaxID=584 RepID=UPI000EF99BA3